MLGCQALRVNDRLDKVIFSRSTCLMVRRLRLRWIPQYPKPNLSVGGASSLTKTVAN
jgi:hypothetical protein